MRYLFTRLETIGSGELIAYDFYTGGDIPAPYAGGTVEHDIMSGDKLPVLLKATLYDAESNRREEGSVVLRPVTLSKEEARTLASS